MEKSKITETILVLTTGFLVVFLMTKIKVFLYVALLFGLLGILIPSLAKYIAIAWFKLADALNYVMSRIILGTVFFLFLFPISLLYKLFKKDKLNLRNPSQSLWTERNHQYQSADLENIW